MAQWIVDLYREAEANGGRLVINPEDPPEEHTVMYAEARWLLEWLDDFAANGTFKPLGDYRAILANAIARQAGPRFKDRIKAIEKELNVTDRTAARLISKKL